MANADEVPENRRVFRYVVEITDLSSGSSHRVPLSFQQVVLILPAARRRRRTSAAAAASQSPEPPEPITSRQPSTDRIRFEDGEFVLEASTWEEFRARLRDQYPDDRFERRLHVQRDREAEVRREEAIQSLIKLIAEGMVDDLLKEQAAAQSLRSGEQGSSTSP